MKEVLERLSHGWTKARMRAAGLTDVGLRRENNEDEYSILRKAGVFIVADGMGGHAAGEVASVEAVRSLERHFTEPVARQMEAVPSEVQESLKAGILTANQHLVRLARESPEFRGMGCALLIAFVHARILHTCHAGDVRGYVCSSQGITQVTNDHSEVAELVRAGFMGPEEARASQRRNILTRALGDPGGVEPEYAQCALTRGDRVVLCTDGLWNMVPDEQIWLMVRGAQDPATACAALIEAANTAGGSDNITAVVIQC